MKKIIGIIVLAGFWLVISPGCKRDSSVTKDPVKLVVSGKLDSVSACKNKKNPVAIGDSTDSICCIFYTFYPDANKLMLKHTDVIFNCCPDSMYATVSEKNDTIFIYESDDYGNCGCICKYDMAMEIHGIEAKEYPFKVRVGPYPYGQNTDFMLDFSKTTSGVYSYKRNY